MKTYDLLFTQALKFLSYRPRSTVEIKNFLIRKGSDQETLKRVTQRLTELELLNDVNFAQWWIEQRSGFNPKGVRLVKSELKQKGIPEEIINLQLKKARDENSDLELARRVIQKFLPRLKSLSSIGLRKKLFSALALRGFDFAVIKEAVDKALKKE